MSVVAALGGATLLLTGCTATETPQPSATVSATPTPSSASTVAAATATPTPDCDSMLTPAAATSLAADNLTSKPFALQPWDYPIAETVDREGTMCAWGNSGDVSFVVGEVPMDAQQWERARHDLLTQGFEENPTIATGFLDGPDREDADYPNRGVVFRDGVLIYISNGERLADVAAFTP